MQNKKQLQIQKLVIIALIIVGMIIFLYEDEKINFILAISYAIIDALSYGIMERIRLILNPSLLIFVFLTNFFRLVPVLVYSCFRLDSEIVFEYLNVLKTDLNECLSVMFSSTAIFMGVWILLNYDALTKAIIDCTTIIIIFGVEQILRHFFVLDSFINIEFGT